MCDHKWILLTSQELERRLGYTGLSVWSVQGCEQCLEMEFKKPIDDRWEPLRLAPHLVTLPLSKYYWLRIALFGGDRNV